MTVLASRPLTVELRRSGGLAGTVRRSEDVVLPGSSAHVAALEVLRSHRLRPTTPPTRRPDGFAYDLAIASPARTVLHRVFRDPLPDDVARLLAALTPPG